MLTNEVKVVERFLKCGENCHCFKCTSWGRIKKFLEESCQLPTTAVKTPAAPSSEGEICQCCTGDGIGADESGWVLCTNCGGTGKHLLT